MGGYLESSLKAMVAVKVVILNIWGQICFRILNFSNFRKVIYYIK